MKCPGCGLYHPPQYEKCVSCGSALKVQESQNQQAVGTPVVQSTERPAASDYSQPNAEQPRKQPPKPRQQAQESASQYQQPQYGQSQYQQQSDQSQYQQQNYEQPQYQQPHYEQPQYRSQGQYEQQEQYEQDTYQTAPEEFDRVEDSNQFRRRGQYQRHDQGNQFDMSDRPPDGSLRRSKHVRGGFKSGMPTSVGLMLAATVLLVSAGAVFFFVTKQPDDERFLEEGQKELANGQYAFAVTTLNKALSVRKKDPKIYLALARAYVGVDQVEKAWDCINQAQQLGLGVVAEPKLASDLANYYRQRGKYERAVELLRPLASANIPGKKAELADLDAMWGDDELRAGRVDQALKCWDEVRTLREGSRYGEADARLATIYQKLANAAANAKEDDKALVYLSKLNAIAQNARNYEMASDIYERTGQLELAIDQLRKAMKTGARNPLLEKKLSNLLSRRGKELLDQGNTDAGYGYLQQAKEMNGDNKLPDITLRDVTTTFEGGMPAISGEVWNSTERTINSLNLKVELYDNVNSRVVWFKDQKVVDEFVPPLGAKDTKPFSFTSQEGAKNNGTFEFRIYLDGTLYKEYPLGKKAHDSGAKTDDADGGSKPALRPIAKPKVKAPPVAPEIHRVDMPPVAPNPGEAPTPAPAPQVTPRGPSSEEKTMKDLEP